MHYNSATADLLTYMSNPSIFDVSDGHVDAPTAPGLGIELNEELIRTVSAKEQNGEGRTWRNAVWRGPDGSLQEW